MNTVYTQHIDHFEVHISKLFKSSFVGGAVFISKEHGSFVNLIGSMQTEHHQSLSNFYAN